MKVHFILYVADQKRSTKFYAAVLQREPALDVSGMTEFVLAGEAILGLMPEKGIEKLLGSRFDHATEAGGSLRAEVYLMVENPAEFHSRAIAAGAIELSPFAPRDWGHSVAYSKDPDGYILAFARPTDGSR